jgi:hypothetical protein
MENSPEQKSSSLSEREEKLWGLYIAVGVQGADDLRKELGLDELNFRRLAPNLNQEPKRYFLYRVLDEIQKAALKIVHWKEYLSEEEPDKLQRIDYETIIDDQQFRARKLVEVLVDAILFSTTNDPAHYRDYFFLHELNECARSQDDRNEFFGFHNKNAEWNAKWLCGEIRTLENAGLDSKSRWYIRAGKVMNKEWTTEGVPFSTFRQRYKQILSIALPSELTVLGKSYVHAYPAYHVKYIEHSPLPDVPEDWFAGFEVRLVAKKEKVEKAADAAGAEIQKSTGKPEDRTKLLDYAKRAMVKLSIYQQQLRQQSPKPSSTSGGDLASKPNTPPKAD